MIEILTDAVLHAGTEHINTTWIAITGVVTFIAGVAVGTYASNKRTDAPATDELDA